MISETGTPTTTTTANTMTPTGTLITTDKINKCDSSKYKSNEESNGMSDKKNITVKTKKSFCIDALLGKNENKNFFGSDFNVGNVKCSNDITKCFRKTAEQVKDGVGGSGGGGDDDDDDDNDERKNFFNVFDKRGQQKSKLFFENVNRAVGNKISDGGETIYESITGKYTTKNLDYDREKYDDVEMITDNKLNFYPERIVENLSECEMRRDCDNSRSQSPFSGKTNETRSNSPELSDNSSPPISPGNENDFRNNLNDSGEDFGSSQIFPRPGLLMTTTTSTTTTNNGSQNFMNQNSNIMLGSRPNIQQLRPHSAFLAYSTPHSFSSAFHPLNSNTGGSVNSKISGTNSTGMKTGISSNNGTSILGLNTGGSQHLHHMQLEWLARTGMFYPRLPDLSGIIYLNFNFPFQNIKF